MCVYIYKLYIYMYIYIDVCVYIYIMCTIEEIIIVERTYVPTCPLGTHEAVANVQEPRAV